MAVADLISSAQSYATGVLGNAKAALDSASSQVSAVGFLIPNLTPVELPEAPPTSVNTTLPTLDTVTLDLPMEPASNLVFQDIPALEAGIAPVLTAIAPTITLPTAPAQLSGFNEQAPSLNLNIAFPEPSQELLNPLIQAPFLTSRSEPVKPQVLLPSFDAVTPTGMPDAPTDYEARYAAAYRDTAPSTIAMVGGYVDAQLTKLNPRFHEQMGRIEAQLAIYLNGGTGLAPAVENAIYERARGKNDADARRVRDAAYQEAAGRGFTLPTGALMAAVQVARQSGADNNARAATEITVLQAEMEQKNLQFAVTTSLNLRQTMVNATLAYMGNLVSINGQALEYAKTVLSAVIEVYNTAARAFGLKLDAYRAEASVYDTRLKAALASLDVYREEIKALEALTNVDRAKVDIYKARIDSLQALASVYRAQIEAVQGRASLEKLKMELFQTKVQAHTAQVQAKNAEWQGFTAQIEGETAKTRIYTSQVDAFQAQVGGYTAGVNAQAKVIEAAALTNKARAEQLASTLSAYQAVVQARGEKARFTLENQRQIIVAFQAQLNAVVAQAQVLNEYYKSTSTVGIANADLKIKAFMAEAGSRTAFGAAIASLGAAGAEVYGKLASAALSGMNSLAVESKSE